MNKLAIIVGVAVVICFLGVGQAQAVSTTGEIAVTVTLNTISIAVSVGDDPWEVGQVAASTENDTTTDYTVTNDGNVTVDVTIICTCTDEWDPAAAAGEDEFIMKAIGGDLLALTSIVSSQELVAGLAKTLTVTDLALQLTAPTSSTVITEQSITITLTAAAAA